MKTNSDRGFKSINNKTTLGLHLMVDAYGVPAKKLDDMKLVYRFLYSLPDLIGMSRLSMPIVVDAEESASKFDPGGISGVILIKESHISIHTFSKRGFFTFDMYSCSNFEDRLDKVINYLKKTFPFKESEIQTVKRGLKYPLKNLK